MAAVAPGAVQAFIEAQDLSLLEEKPLAFERAEDDFVKLLCCAGLCTGVASLGLTCFCTPVAVFCPGRLATHFHLQLDKDAVQLSSAANDCCFHVALSKKTVPLDKVQDVQLTTGWVESLFGLQTVSVETAGGTGPLPEITATFLKHPEQAREALRLAVKLHQARAVEAPAQAPGMQRGGGRTPGSSGGVLAGRLQRLEAAVAAGALAREEAAAGRAGILAAELDITPLLLEAAALQEQGLITPTEFRAMKAKWLAQAAAL